MNNRYKVIIIIIGVLLIFLVGVFVRKSQKVKLDLDTLTDDKTFYATVESIRESNDRTMVFVKGLETNEMDYRGMFNFSIEDDIIITTCRGEKIDISDMKVGDTVIITFNDKIINDIIPTPLEKITKIEIVDDE